MSELIVKEEVLDMVSIDSIKTLEQADEILEACNASDGDVVETYVQNAITRGAVYHKLTEVGNGGLGLLNEEVGERYNTTKKTIGVYINIYKDGDIILRKLSASVTQELLELKPTLRSLQDTINKDYDVITKNIINRIKARGAGKETRNIISNYMMDEAPDDVRYEFSIRSKIAYGKLAKNIIAKDEDAIMKTIKQNGVTDVETKETATVKENLDLRREIKELQKEVEMLKRRNKFLIDSFKLSDVKRFLNRALTNESKLRRYKPQMQEAMDILGVDTTVNEGKLKEAYRSKVREHHSDLEGNNDDMFRKIIEANKLVKEFIEGL